MNFNRILKYVILGGLFLVPLVPLVVADGRSITSLFFPSLLFPFISGKGFFFRIIVEIIFSGWVILAFRDSKYWPKKSFILWALGTFLAIITIADIGSMNPFKSFWSNFERMEGLITHIHLFLYFIVASTMLSTWKLWNWFLHTNIAIGLFLTFYSFLQLGGGLVINQGAVRVDGTLGNAAYLAVYLLFSLFTLLFLLYMNQAKAREILFTFAGGSLGFIIFYLSHISQKGVSGSQIGTLLSLLAFVIFIGSSYLISLNYRKALPNYVSNVLYGILIVAELVIFYYTATRGSIIGFILGLSFIFVALAFFERKNKLLQKFSIASVAVIILLSSLFFFSKDTDYVKKSPVLSRFSSLFSYDVNTFLNSGDGKTRYLNAQSALQGFKEKPLFGWGQESFNYVFNKYFFPKMFDQEAWFDRAHNVIFDWLVAGGILGLLAYLSIFVSVFFYLIKGRSEGEMSLPFFTRLVIAGMLIAYFFQNLTIFDNITSYIFFFTILAFVHFINGTEFSHKKKNKNDNENIGSSVVSVVVVIFLITSLYYFNVRGILVSSNLISALSPQKEGLAKNFEYYKKALSHNVVGKGEVREFLSQTSQQVYASQGVDQKVKEEYAFFAKSELDKQIKETPEDIRYYYIAGILMNKEFGPKAAIPYFEKAVELSPRKQLILLDLAFAYLSDGSTEKAIATLKKTYELEPSYISVKILYALGLVYANDEVTAEKLFGQEYEALLLNDVRFLNAYVAAKKYTEAISLWKKWIEKDPKNVQYRMSLAGVYLKIDDRLSAILQLQKVIEIDPTKKQDGEALIKAIREGRRVE